MLRLRKVSQEQERYQRFRCSRGVIAALKKLQDERQEGQALTRALKEAC
jgi:hypothetical protein